MFQLGKSLDNSSTPHKRGNNKRKSKAFERGRGRGRGSVSRKLTDANGERSDSKFMTKAQETFSALQSPLLPFILAANQIHMTSVDSVDSQEEQIQQLEENSVPESDKKNENVSYQKSISFSYPWK